MGQRSHINLPAIVTSWIITVQGHLRSMLTALWDIFSPHMLLSQRHRAGPPVLSPLWTGDLHARRLYFYFPTSSRNAVKLLTASQLSHRSWHDNGVKTKGSVEDFPGHNDVRTVEVVTEFTENSTRQLTESQKELNGIRTNSWFWLPSNFKAGGHSDGTEQMGGSVLHWKRK